jgi:transposase
VGEIAGARRFATAAKLARAAGVAPIPAGSGTTQRHRLDPGGNRQINAALHRAIVTHARCHPPTRDYIERRRGEGKSTPLVAAIFYRWHDTRARLRERGWGRATLPCGEHATSVATSVATSAT